MNSGKTMDPIDPVHYVSHAAPSNLFFQFGTGDTFYPREPLWIFMKQEACLNPSNGMTAIISSMKMPVRTGLNC